MREITLLGRGKSWRDCSYRDRETWATLSLLSETNRRIDRVFAVDTPSSPIIQKNLAIAKERGIPVCGSRDYCTMEYPLFQIAQRFQSNYFRNTMSYMIALALYEDYDRLWIYGIDQGPQWTYITGKPHITFWLGYALALGKQLKLAKGSVEWMYHVGIGGEHYPLLDKDEAQIVYQRIEEALVGER